MKVLLGIFTSIPNSNYSNYIFIETIEIKGTGNVIKQFVLMDIKRPGYNFSNRFSKLSINHIATRYVIE